MIEYIEKKNVGLIEKLSILLKIGKALQWLEKMGICHRDIKPQNIMIDKNR